MSLPPEPDDDSTGWGMRWEQVRDDADAPDPRRRRHVRLLVAACVVGALAVVAVTVVAVRAGLHDVNRPSGPQRIHDRYETQYRACIAGGTAPGSCAERIMRRCEDDPGWGGNRDAPVISRQCRFGVVPQASTSASSTAS